MSPFLLMPHVQAYSLFAYYKHISHIQDMLLAHVNQWIPHSLQ